MQERMLKKDQMLGKCKQKGFYCKFLPASWVYTVDGAEKSVENATGAAGAMPEAEDDALGERPQNVITLLLVLCPELRLMRSVSVLKCSI